MEEWDSQSWPSDPPRQVNVHRAIRKARVRDEDVATALLIRARNKRLSAKFAYNVVSESGLSFATVSTDGLPAYSFASRRVWTSDSSLASAIPKMHLAWAARKNIPCIVVVEDGMHDSSGAHHISLPIFLCMINPFVFTNFRVGRFKI